MGTWWGIFLHRVLGYRLKVVRSNMKRVYPLMGEAELQRMVREFYRYFGNLLWEILFWHNPGPQRLQNWVRFDNPEVLDSLAVEGKGVALLTSHYGNWEWIAWGMASRFRHRLWFVYKPLSRAWMEGLLFRWRSGQGVVPVPIKALRPRLDRVMQAPFGSEELPALYLGADQSPTAHSRWIQTTLLGQPTLSYQGPEELARRYGLVPVFVRIRPNAKGRGYRVQLVQAPEDWSLQPEGTLMQWYLDALSQQILEAPAYWLWTHRRWKLEAGRERAS